MKISELASFISGARIKGPDKVFSALKANSSAIVQGDTFVALKGSITDGHVFIHDAISAGAESIICNYGGCDIPHGITIIEVPDTKSALKSLLPILYPHAKKVSLVGITGTNGKTTTTYLIESVLKASGINPGVVGTINMRYSDKTMVSSITTPGPIDLFQGLDTMSRAGAEVCIMEVSSHALDQDRLIGLGFDYAIFTNLSQDHLDYHKDMDTYFLAKKKLFENYLNGVAVINIDDPYGTRLAKVLNNPITYGRDSLAAVRATTLEHIPSGLHVNLKTPHGDISINSSLLGDINVYNIMATVAVCGAMGIDKPSVIAGIGNLEKVPGRMEMVENPYNLQIIIDYAHTPAALQTALESARGFTRGRLITIFGCGGDRDQAKRPLMGKIASEISDMVVITSDNPRTEDPQAIIDNILEGITGDTDIMVEPDRNEAIRLGISSMSADDCLIIAGKGHEDYQIIGQVKKPFDDKISAEKNLKEIFG
jgi:UDP-N-acetylmuramoyl-L-alanyl-D-glutamate--2,6-diaminopimelate ligase